MPTSLGSYKAAVPLPPSPLNSNFSGASGLHPAAPGQSRAGSPGSEDTPPLLPFPPPGPHPFRRRGEGTRSWYPPGRGGPRLRERFPPPSPVPSSGLSQRPLGGRREHQPRRRESSAPGSPGLGPHSRGQRTGDSQLPSSRRGTPGAKKCHRPTSPHAVPTQALHPHRSRDALLGSRLGAITRGRSPGVGTWEGI